MARPKKEVSENRTVRREVKFTPKEAEELEKKQDGLSFSDYARKATLGMKPRVEKANGGQATLLKVRAALAKLVTKVNEVGGSGAVAIKQEINVISDIITEGLK